MLDGCNPIDGSSSTYKTPVVRLRTARANCIRWRSPVDKVAEARSRVKYPRPKSISRREADKKASAIFCAISRISAGIAAGTAATHAVKSTNVFWQTSAKFRPHTRGARAAALKREPPQSGQVSRFKNFSTRFMPCSSFTLANAFFTV